MMGLRTILRRAARALLFRRPAETHHDRVIARARQMRIELGLPPHRGL